MADDSTQPVARRFGRSGVLGTVRSVRMRPDAMTLELDQDGADPVTVEYADPAHPPGVRRGDLIEAGGKLRDGVLHAKRLFNHSTGLAVESGSRRGGQRSPALFLGAIVIGVLAIIVLSVLSTAGVFSSDPKREDLIDRARQECYRNTLISKSQCDAAFKDK